MSTFDGLAGTITARVMAGMNADMERAAVAAIDVTDDEDVLVVGCGPGVGLTALLGAAAPASITAVDPSQAMLRAARRRLAGHPGATRVRLVAATAAEAPGAAGGGLAVRPDGQRARFDAALAVNSEQLWQPHDASLRAVAAALRPGGRLVTLTHEWAISKRQPVDAWKDTVTADLRAAGLSDPEWWEDDYRSGAGLGLRAHKPSGGTEGT